VTLVCRFRAGTVTRGALGAGPLGARASFVRARFDVRRRRLWPCGLPRARFGNR